MKQADRLAWAIARYVAEMPRGTIFPASGSATAGVRLSQELLGCRLALFGHGGAYDPRGILALHARPWLFNQRPRSYATVETVFNTLSEPMALLATPGQVDGSGNANLSGVGEWARPKVAFGGTRGLPDARTVHFVVPSHHPRQLVDRVDFISTSVVSRRDAALLFTELCVMRWNSAGQMWRLETLLPGADLATVQRRTGFRFEVPDDVAVLDEPSPAVLAVLERIDPLRVRDLDFIADRLERWEAIERIYQQEVALAGVQILPE